MGALRLFAVVLLAVTPALGQSFNLDLDVAGGIGGGAPASTFAGAASQPGVWNVVPAAGTAPFTLANLMGVATGVTLTRTSAGAGNFAFNNGNTSGDFELLLDDLQCVGNVVGALTVYNFNNLAAGMYDVYSYAGAPDNETFITNVSVTNSTSTNPQAVGGVFPFNAFMLGITHARHTVAVAAGAPLTITFDALSGFASVDGVQIVASAPPMLVDILSANPPTAAANGGVPFRDILQNTDPALVAQGIGVTGTPAEGTVVYAPFQVTFSGTPNPAPTVANITRACTDSFGNGQADCPTVTNVTGAGAGPYSITLSLVPPTRECITFTFAGTNAGQKLQYQNLPGDINLNGTTTGQDVVALVAAINAGTATVLARFDINRNGTVTGQDVIRLVQLLNGGVNVVPTSGYNAVAVAACP